MGMLGRVPDDPRTPGDPAREATTSPTRRKFLVTGAFVAASMVGLRALPHRVSSRARTPSDGDDRGTGNPHDAAPALEDAPTHPESDHVYDVVIRNGRVIDPDSGFDAKVPVGIDGGTITGLGSSVGEARTTIDARGKVVAPGFIDILSYEPNPEGSWYKIADGVTTNLGMHGMQQGWWLPKFFDEFTGRTPVNFGGAFSQHWVRFHELGLDVGATATSDQRGRLVEILGAQLAEGWLGVAMEPEYTPGVDFAELVAMGEVAARAEVPCVVHGRYSSYADEHKTVPELIRLCEQTGASVHIAHLPSTGGTWDIGTALDEIDAAVAAGHDVTFDLYPYDYWGTYAASTRFAPGWQDRFQITYDDLQVAGTTGRLTASTFATAQANNSLTIAYAIPESSVRRALAHPRSIIGSDAIVDTGNNHPRASGTFCRVLGHWVREKKVLSLTDALAKMTILPARLCERRSPGLARKGRIQRGADADICVFDPATVIDRATVADPVAYSEGIDWVLVGGTVVKDPDGLKRNRLPGAPVKSVGA